MMRIRADLDQLYQRVGSVVEQELPGAALFGRSREKEAAPAPALQLKLHLWPYVVGKEINKMFINNVK